MALSLGAKLKAGLSSMRVAQLKVTARLAYQRYYRELDGMDCGRHMAEQVNPRLREAKLEFNSTMDELALLDPKCPKSRL